MSSGKVHTDRARRATIHAKREEAAIAFANHMLHMRDLLAWEEHMGPYYKSALLDRYDALRKQKR